jgi:hypothetical protein
MTIAAFLVVVSIAGLFFGMWRGARERAEVAEQVCRHLRDSLAAARAGVVQWRELAAERGRTIELLRKKDSSE